MFSKPALVALLLASISLAIPTSESAPEVPLTRRGQNSNIEYNPYWGGGGWSKQNGTFNNVVGTFTVPTVSSPDGTARIWVGIDGNACLSALLQAGVMMSYNNSEASWNAFYQRFPALPVTFSDTDITVNPGDVIQANVTAYSTTDGIAIVNNLSNGQSASQYITSTTPLCLHDAEWVIEDPAMNFIGGPLFPFPGFSSVAWTDGIAKTISGDVLTPVGADILDIASNGQFLTWTIIDDAGQIITNYTGP